MSTSPAFAIATVAVLFVLLLVPLGLAAWKGVASMALVSFYIIILALIGAYHSGMFSRVRAPDLDLSRATGRGLADTQCVEVLELMDGAGAIADRSRPPRVIVVQKLWSQLPEAAQQVVVECIQRSWPADAAPAQVEAR